MTTEKAMISRRDAEAQSSSLRASAPLRETRLFPSRNYAFTMIELLVVIGIILILMGLFFAGAKIVTAQAKARDTKSMLETAKTMFANYQQQTSLYVNPTTNFPKGANVAAFNDGINGSPQWTYGWEQAPQGVVSPDGLGLTNTAAVYNPNSFTQAIENTLIVMQAMMSIQENQTIINNLPASKVLIRNYTNSNGATVSIPLLLDGYGNVILFSPGGGLWGVWVDPSTQNFTPEVITSEGMATTTGWSAPKTTAIIANKPFFFSAGPDGDPSNSHGNGTTYNASANQSEDNVYSFQP